MKENKSIISKILNRKIPQIIGMYIASVWLLVEISNWMSGRFKLPDQFDTYVFVFLLALLPAVIVIAWGHGKPGEDSWSMFELLWIPFNLVLAVLASFYLVSPSLKINPSAITAQQVVEVNNSAMQKMSIVDTETGKKITYEVPKLTYHQSVITFFLKNNSKDETLNWLSYGAGWLIAQDLRRTPFLSIITPYDSENLLSFLIGKGFNNALEIPLALALKIAANRSVKWVILGSFEVIDNNIKFKTQLYNVRTGKQVKEITASNDNPLAALDVVSDALGQVILDTLEVEHNDIPQLAITEHTSANIDAIHDVIKAKNAVTFENDYELSNQFLEQALSKDSSFALAHVLFMNNYRALGDIGKTMTHASKALKLDYKLYQETVFFVKATLFSLKGKQDKAIKVLENLVKLYPKSVNALKVLAGNYMQIGHHQEQSKELYEKVYEYEGQGSTSLINLSKIERLRNNKDKALEYLTRYLNDNPTKSRAYFELAETYRQFGMFEEAKEMYEEISLYDNKDYQSEIGLATISASLGDYESAIIQFESLLQIAQTDTQKLTILGKISEIYLLTGQLSKSIDQIKELTRYGTKVLPPVAFMFQIEGSKIYLLALMGKFKESQVEIEKLAKNLKHPYSLLIGALSKNVYELTNDLSNYKIALQKEQTFMDMFKIAVLKPDILMSEAFVSYLEKDYQKAENLYEQAIIETKQSFITLITTTQFDNIIIHQAENFIALEKYDEAIMNLDIVLTRTPIFAQAHFLKARIYANTGEKQKMQKEIDITSNIWKNADEEYVEYIKFIKFKTMQKNGNDE